MNGLWHKIIPGMVLLVSSAALVIGFLSISLNTIDMYTIPLLIILASANLLLMFTSRIIRNTISKKMMFLTGLAVIYPVIISLIPETFNMGGVGVGNYNLGQAVINRSVVSAVFILASALPVFSYALFFLKGATPSAKDLARYPVIVFPVLIVLICYLLVLIRLMIEGVPQLDWQVITSSYDQASKQVGMSNHILGTLLLIILVSIISLPVGIGTGAFISEYAGKSAGIIRFCTTALRGVSVFILGITAYSLVRVAENNYDFPLAKFITGYYRDANGYEHIAHGSFILSAIFLSMLVIPLIASATEEGLRSVPLHLKEGSLAMGASQGYTFTHILLPWSMPNIITGWLLGCAEAAGSVSILIFMATTGEAGVGPFSEVISLSHLIFNVNFGGPKSFRDTMVGYEYSAALLLIIITLSFGVASLILKRAYSKRYQA
ncbi:MAG: ABC transporter permease subunit [Dehalococcoidales bacterium]